MRALTVEPDGTIELHDRPDFAYSWLRERTGGSIAPIDLEEEGQPTASMYVHDEGKLISLDRNRVAERLANHYGAIFSGDWIAGPVVIVGLDERSGDSCELTEAFVRQALRIMTGEIGNVKPIRVAPTYWENVAEWVYAGVPVVAVGGPEAFPPPEQEEQA